MTIEFEVEGEGAIEATTALFALSRQTIRV
jgi:hypothetical protein